MREHNGKVYIEGDAHDFKELLEIIKILRGENGCEWDRAQTYQSMRECLRNETEEVINAIDNNNLENLCEELGDVLLQVLMNCRIAEEKGDFTFSDVVQTLSDKLIRRHPHVFGDEKRPSTPEESLKMWIKVKEKEKNEKNKNRVF